MNEPKLKPQLKIMATYYVGECAGNAEKSAVKAGYSKNYARGNAYKLVARADFQAYIQWLRSEKSFIPRRIMEIDELQEWWSNVIKNEEVKMSDRLRASEYLAKSKGAFTSEW